MCARTLRSLSIGGANDAAVRCRVDEEVQKLPLQCANVDQASKAYGNQCPSISHHPFTIRFCTRGTHSSLLRSPGSRCLRKQHVLKSSLCATQGARKSPEICFAGRKWLVTQNRSYYIAQVEDYLARRGADNVVNTSLVGRTLL